VLGRGNMFCFQHVWTSKSIKNVRDLIKNYQIESISPVHCDRTFLCAWKCFCTSSIRDTS
jgi:hypothetical protein